MATKLADDETYLKKYDNLSRGDKQELDLAKRARLKEAQAEANAGDSFVQRGGDAVGRVIRSLAGSPSAKRQQDEVDVFTAKRESERQRRLQEAKDSANYKERDRAAYGSNTPGKIKDNMVGMKKGGAIMKQRFNDGGIYTAEMGKPPTDPEGVSSAKKPMPKKPTPKKPVPKDSVFREGMPVPQDIDGKSAPRKFSSGGSASKRADGCATKGKTKGSMITMYGGGKC